MKVLAALFMCLVYPLSDITAQRAVSPNGRLTMELTKEGYVIATKSQQTVVTIPSVGFSDTPKPINCKPKRVVDDYTMLAGKRSHCFNEVNEYRIKLGSGTTMIVRLYNDGLAFCYEKEQCSMVNGQCSKVNGQCSMVNGQCSKVNGQCSMVNETTTYRIPEGTKRWMQQWSDGYEGFFPYSTSSQSSLRWGYPALIEPVDGLFALITEANIMKGHSASSLYNEGELFRVVPDKTNGEENNQRTPWRVVIVGTLADIVESTLVTDVSDPTQYDDVSWIHPGVVSWVYWAYNHGSNDYNIICKYVDLAHTLKLPYVLIDAEWDEMKDGKTIVDAVNYAKAQGVKPLIWYNSSVGWIDGAPGPKFRLNKPEDREKEFEWCEKIGVAGVKIDFFAGDTQANMAYMIDLLQCAERHHLLVNFHGATIPRGWQRTYPNLLSTEGVYGAEWYNNVPTFTDKAACHNATLPFTRNVVGPMDYTPCAFSDSQHPHITSLAHELALTVLFESGLQHLADRPESFLAQPMEVRQFLSMLPAAWDETRFVSGYPGKSVVIARRKGDRWFVAGINGTDAICTVDIDSRVIADKNVPDSNGLEGVKWQMFADDGNGGWSITTTDTLPKTVTCQPRGGFLLTVEP